MVGKQKKRGTGFQGQKKLSSYEGFSLDATSSHMAVAIYLHFLRVSWTHGGTTDRIQNLI